MKYFTMKLQVRIIIFKVDDLNLKNYNLMFSPIQNYKLTFIFLYWGNILPHDVKN